jgi:hypothetical protein
MSEASFFEVKQLTCITSGVTLEASGYCLFTLLLQ